MKPNSNSNSKTIVLAEKPSVGKEIARVLGCHKKSKTHIEGKDYIVTWAMGHLIELADPSAYNPDWQGWKMEHLPMLPDKMKHSVIRRTSHQFRTIKGLLHRKDVSNVIIATDAGREGELVARWIIRLAGYKGPFQRLWISSQTDKAIKDGFRNLKPGRQYDALFHAAESRAEADWIVGLNITRALSCRHDSRLSAGRVQTPTLAMIINRENDIKNFQPKPYHLLEADFGAFQAGWRDKNGQNRLFSAEKAQGLREKLTGAEGLITDLAKKRKEEPAPLAYDLTELQRDGNTILNFSAKQTLQVLQGLYERHKVVTYPRTDSRCITTDMVDTLKERLKALSATRYRKEADALIKSDLKPSKRFVNNAKVTDHHAIIPTEEAPVFDRMSGDEKALYDLIARRFVAVLMPPAKMEVITLTCEAGGETFTAKGRKELDRGWKKIHPAVGSDDETHMQSMKNLESLKKGDAVKIKEIHLRQKMTSPPARFTEATLLTAMENPGAYIQDTQLRKAISKGGLGTPATRADIIEKLLKNYYIERQGKSLLPTPAGIELIPLVPEELRSPALTAQWEQRLSAIAEGREKPKAFTSAIRENARALVKEIRESKAVYDPHNSSDKECPLCGKKMIKVKNKKGKTVIVCRSLKCGYEEEKQNPRDITSKPSQREKAISRRMMGQYGAKEESGGSSFADLLKAAEDRKKRGKGRK